MSKQIEFLHETMAATTIALIVNPNNPNAASDISDAKMATQKVGQQVIVLNASTAGDIDTVFASLSQLRADALLVATDAFLFDRRDQLVGLAARYAISSMFSTREFVTAGGLMSYAGDLSATDGTPPARFVVIGFDSLDRAKAWDAAPIQQEVNAIRKRATKSRQFLVEALSN
jgi:ABC-type uncharacterized transport system substrate-binding protein